MADESWAHTLRCDAEVLVKDDRFPIVNRCERQLSHKGQHMHALNACEPKAVMRWWGKYERKATG